MSEGASSTTANLIKVLLVDDDESQMELTKLNLELADPSFKITIMLNPLEALELLANQSFDCIVSDYQMKGINGIQFSSEIRKTSNVPIIIYTGRGSEEVASAAFTTGVDDYVKKEPTLSHYAVLAKRIRHVVEKSRAESALKESQDQLNSMLGRVTDNFVSFDDQWRYVYANDSALRTLRKTRDEVIGKVVWEVFPDLKDSIYGEKYREAMEKQTPLEFEAYYEPFDMWTSMKLFPSPQGLTIYYHDITESKKAEEMLSTTLQRLEAHINNSPLAVIEFDTEFRVIRWSDEAERMFGWKATEILGKSIAEMRWVYEDDAEQVQKESAALFSGVKPKGLNVNRNYRKDGSVIWCEWYSSAIYDSNGKLASILSLVLDVTERRRRREENTRLASFPQLNPNPVLEADSSGRVLYMNAAASSEFPEVSQEGNVSPLQLNWVDIVSQLEGETGKSITRDTKINGLWYSLSLHMVSDSENVRIYATNIDERKRSERALIDANEELSSINEELAATEEELRTSNEELSTSNEELRTTEDELRAVNEQVSEYADKLEQTVDDRTRELGESEERLRAFLDSSDEGYSVYDSDLRLLDLNKEALRRLPKGTRKKDVVGKRVNEIYPGIEGTQWYPAYLEVLRTGVTYIAEGLSVGIQGNLLLSASAFKVGEGLGVVSRDVTRRRRLEERLKRAEVIAAVEQMGATVAHDLRGPLGLVVQAVNMIKQDPSLTPRMLQIVEENAVRSLKMIADWRSSTREIVPHPGTTDVVRLIKGVLDGSTIPQSVEVVTSFGDGLDNVNVDGDILNRVLDNLVKNAVEAMPNGGRLEVGVAREVDELVIKVADTGVGIPDESRDRIFSPLYTTKTGGMGLGLTYCRRAVEAMGGTIEFTSNVGVGTIFSVKLPINS